MKKIKSRFIISIVICISLFASQTFVAFGLDDAPKNQPPVIQEETTSVGAPQGDVTPGEVLDDEIASGDALKSGIQKSGTTSGTQENATKAPASEEDLIEAVTIDPVKGSEFDGYIVNVKDNQVSKIDETEKQKTIVDEIADDLVVIENPEDAAKFVPAEAIECIEPNYIVKAQAFPQSSPIDPFFTNNHNYQWGLKKINTNVSWGMNLRGSGINVAVIDSGLNFNHEDINKSKILQGKSCMDYTASYDDDHGHGSFVTSIIAAKINNSSNGKGIGMAGITDEINIISYKTLNKDGEGSLKNVYAAYEALQKSGYRVDVINLSLGHEEYSPTENTYIQSFISKGTIVIAAVGNDGTQSGSKKNMVTYPAGYKNVIAVGSIESNGKVSDFSSKNPTVDVSAPGSGMVGIAPASTNKYIVGGRGTSYAAPVVSAAAVIAKQMNRSINATNFQNALKYSVSDVGAAGWDISYGYGVLNIESMTNYLKGEYGKVSFNANKGKKVKTTKTLAKGATYGALPKPTRKGYAFKGWYTKKKGGTKVKATSKKTASKSVTLYAQWSKKYKVKFNANGGKKVGKNKSVAYNFKYGKLPTASRSNYGFLGWYTKKSGGSKIKESSKMKFKKNITLYAQWGKKYTVKFNPNKGTVSQTNKKVTRGAKYGTLPKPTREDYKFEGWYTKKSGGSKITSKTKANMKKNQTLYARWTKK